ncbi:MAG: AmmeMemoRadiSam system radical SAM enzyme [Dehalobacterium sp.]|jgi:pyruvate formate lyase activating enzyme
MKEALYYRILENNRILCELCPRNCVIKPGNRGFCRARENRDGVLFSLNYGKITALAVDPIEKKPLYHFFPGSKILSVGTFGCNFHCDFCQNWQIAHQSTTGEEMTPEALASLALEMASKGSIGVAYTYSEPLVWYEFVLAASQKVQEAGLKNVLVTNGYIQEEPFQKLLPYIDAFNIDVKGFTKEFYQKVVKGKLAPVLKSAEMAYQAGKHLEITTLLIPGLNDAPEEIEALVDWISLHLGPEVPLHFSRYFPQYRLNLAPTPIQTMYHAREIAEKTLKHIYLGNV